MTEQNKPATSHVHKLIPKLELHAHLNGSLSQECLQKLSDLKANHATGYNFTAFQDLKSCFDVFAIAHALTDSRDAVKLATKYCIQEFANDNVVYLELRSTPRATETMTKTEYVAAIIDEIKESRKITTTLIVSINRGNSVKEAYENIDVAIEFAKLYPEIVVGVDLCGNPADGKFADFVPVLNKARLNGLKITLHCGEIKNDAEVLEMIHYRPERLSHVTCLTSEAVEQIKNLRIPVELCVTSLDHIIHRLGTLFDSNGERKVPSLCIIWSKVTSNLKCKTVGSVKEHQLGFYYPADHPFILGTDDKGVFDTTLSAEYALVQEAFNLREEFFWTMNQKAVEFCFASETVKKQLKEKVLN